VLSDDIFVYLSFYGIFCSNQTFTAGIYRKNAKMIFNSYRYINTIGFKFTPKIIS